MLNLIIHKPERRGYISTSGVNLGKQPQECTTEKSLKLLAIL